MSKAITRLEAELARARLTEQQRAARGTLVVSLPLILGRRVILPVLQQASPNAKRKARVVLVSRLAGESMARAYNVRWD